MYFIVGADIVPTDSNVDLFSREDVQGLLGEDLLSIFDNASFRILNLEVPLTDKEAPIQKCGPNLIAPASTANGIKKLNIDLLTLANNHILDQGPDGLLSTISELHKRNIGYVGAGANVEAARKPFTFDFAGKKVGVYACAEHEFSIATDKTPGANPFDPLWSLDHVEELKRSVDFVVVLYHGGKEYYRYPSPKLQKSCRRLIDKGADLVICQHSHCIGCEEKYGEGTIVYGQGNFLFDGEGNEFWNSSLLISVDEKFAVSYIPLVKYKNVVRMADSDAGRDILKGLAERSEEIKSDDVLKDKYTSFANQYAASYFGALMGRRTLPFRVLNKLSRGRYKQWLMQKLYTNQAKVRILNYIECEAHNELFLQHLKGCIKDR